MVVATVIHLSYPLAFLAGLVSFLSPCVFPLVPAYAAFLGGRAGEAATAEIATAPAGGAAAVALGGGGSVSLGGSRGGLSSSPRVTPRAPLLANGVAFVVGFSVVFVAFYYVFTALQVTLFTAHRRTFDIAAGSVIILLGLQTLGLLRIGALARDRRIHLLPQGAGLLPSFLLGLTFAAGWTPCIGPQLSYVLTVAGQGDFAGLPVMLVYCAGLAIPFLAVSLAADRLQGTIRAVNRRLGIVNLVAGGILVVFGLLLIADRFTFFNQFAAQSPFDL